ncbi:hypothetical protein HK105_202498 [Polyrhizophydium stewartii]|uniref:Pentatricopeptide repeat-containing protein n=1 Tax=Polyrhizophydium stewartii TaxID=2732419 RepID=A0ABR4NEW5_9FUNG
MTKGDDAAADNQKRQQPVVLRARKEVKAASKYSGEGFSAPGTSNSALAEDVDIPDIAIADEATSRMRRPISPNTPKQTAELLGKLTNSIDSNYGPRSVNIFQTLETQSPDALAHLAPTHFSKLVYFVLFSQRLSISSDDHERHHLVECIYQRARSFGLPSTPLMLQHLAESYARVGDVAAVEKLAAAIHRHGLPVASRPILAARSRAYMVAGQSDKGMLIWGKLADLDLDFAYTYLANTHIMLGDWRGLFTTLRSIGCPPASELLGNTAACKALGAMLQQDKMDEFFELLRMLKMPDSQKVQELWLDATRRIAVKGRFQEALDNLAAMRWYVSSRPSLKLSLEILALAGLGQTNEIKSLLRIDDRHNRRTVHNEHLPSLLVERIGGLKTKAQLAQALETDSVLQSLGSDKALPMLLRGYATAMDGESMHTVFIECLRRRVSLQGETQRLVAECALRQLGPKLSLSLFDALLTAKMRADVAAVDRLVGHIRQHHPELLFRAESLRAEAVRRSGAGTGGRDGAEGRAVEE